MEQNEECCFETPRYSDPDRGTSSVLYSLLRLGPAFDWFTTPVCNRSCGAVGSEKGRA